MQCCDEKYLNAIIASSRARTKCAIAKLSVRENERELRKGKKNNDQQQQNGKILCDGKRDATYNLTLVIT